MVRKQPHERKHKKTKEMLLGSIGKTPPSAVQLASSSIDRIHSYKLLGLHVSDTLKWNDHVSSICSRASTRLHFLKLMKRAAMSTDDLIYYYQSVVRPVTEYACAVWNSSLTKGQTRDVINQVANEDVRKLHAFL